MAKYMKNINKDIIVVSKQTFDNIMKTENITDDNVSNISTVAFISITDTDKFSASREPYFKINHDNVLNLSFDDCEEDGEASPTQTSGTKAFTTYQASEIYNFVKNNEDKITFVVHCMAGISRSGAVGAFINDYFRGSYLKFKRNNPQVCPNARVSRLLNREMNNITE